MTEGLWQFREGLRRYLNMCVGRWPEPEWGRQRASCLRENGRSYATDGRHFTFQGNRTLGGIWEGTYPCPLPRIVTNYVLWSDHIRWLYAPPMDQTIDVCCPTNGVGLIVLCIHPSYVPFYR